MKVLPSQEAVPPEKPLHSDPKAYIKQEATSPVEPFHTDPKASSSAAPAASGVPATNRPAPSILGKRTEEEGSPAAQDPRARAAVANGLRAARRRITGILVNAVNFTMGFGFFGLAKTVWEYCFGGPLNAAPLLPRSAVLWGCAGIAAVIFVPIMGLLAWRRAKLERRLDVARLSGDTELSARLHVQIGAMNTFTSWGCAFTLAGQIDAAAMASVPPSPWGWRALYMSLLVFAVISLATFVTMLGDCCAGRCGRALHAAVSDAVVAGSAYGVALAFLGTISGAFGIEEVGLFKGSEDLGYLAIFTVITLVVASAACALLVCATQAAARVYEDQGIAGFSKTFCTRLGSALHELITKTMLMCSVVAIYALVYVSLSRSDVFGFGGGRASVFHPLKVEGALLFLAFAVAVTFVGGGLLHRGLEKFGEGLALIDRNVVPGPIDDLVLDSLGTVTKTATAALSTALAWLVGVATDCLAKSVWGLVLSEAGKTTDGAAQVGFALAYAALVTIIAVATTLCCALPPPGV